MGNGRIFLKTRHDASINKDLSNEPNFDRIHLVGQYLYTLTNSGSGHIRIHRMWHHRIDQNRLCINRFMLKKKLFDSRVF